jgi:Family of unknown function (DUF6152)
VFGREGVATMNNTRRRSTTGGKLCALVAGLVLMVGSVSAHHGSSISYDTTRLWSTWVTVTRFNYMNPHPTMTFDRKVEGGKVEHWAAELLTNPSMMARQGWTKGRTLEALRPGARVKLYLATARAGGFSAIVMKVEDESGQTVAGAARDLGGVDLDGKPGGLQPEGNVVLPGQQSQ